jgi:hypothetical protein
MIAFSSTENGNLNIFGSFFPGTERNKGHGSLHSRNKVILLFLYRVLLKCKELDCAHKLGFGNYIGQCVIFFFFFYYFYIYSYVYALFGTHLPAVPMPLLPLPSLLTSRQNLFCPLVLQFF